MVEARPTRRDDAKQAYNEQRLASAMFHLLFVLVLLMVALLCSSCSLRRLGAANCCLQRFRSN
eukprot:8732397-Pyramimonas_sp.AAC.1